MTNDAAHLTAAIADLRVRRDAIDKAIASMEEVLATVYGVRTDEPLRERALRIAGGTTTGRINPPPRMGTRPGTRADRVRRVIVEGPADAVWTAHALAEAINEEPDEHTIKAIHAIVSRLHKAAVIDKLGYGEYRVHQTADPDPDPEPAVVVTEGDGNLTVHSEADGPEVSTS